MAAKLAGFDAISLYPEQFLNARHREKLSDADMQEILKIHAIRVATIDPLLDWFGPSESAAEKLMYEVADVVQAPRINLAPAFAPNIGLSEISDAFARVCERAAQRGLEVDLEVLPWSVIPDYPKLFDIVLGSGQDNAFVTLDCLHFYRSGGVPRDLEILGREKLQRISNLQLCDIRPGPLSLNWRQKLSAGKTMLASGWDGARTMGLKSMIDVSSKSHNTREDASVLMREAMCSRLLPGRGSIPLTEILQTLDRLSCHPVIGLEISSLAMNKLAPDVAAKQAMSAYRVLTE
ncbi:MAG: TIM barrel protein [Halioglobus sp.]